MNLKRLITLSFTTACLLPGAFVTCQAQASDGIDADEDADEEYDLADMTDEELEEICVSRGFELVRELDKTTGDEVVYTHQDYVDAASECLQIEEDL